MTTTGKTRAELAAWLDRWNENGAAPSAETVVDFLGIELAPEPMFPVGQRRRSPEGVEVIKTDGVSALCWQRYAGVGKTWFSDDAIADWQIVTDAPEVPENIIEAVILTLRADDHEQRTRLHQLPHQRQGSRPRRPSRRHPARGPGVRPRAPARWARAHHLQRMV